ncbi:MAG: glycosyltransferase family 4 protein [Paracoccaceae bacterium]|nr:glycosyltransferase family 4 protein [Paracoccaceae bacterium]
MAERPKIAFYAPMKAPDHPRPSGDREIARLTFRALDAAGFAPFTASDLRSLDLEGDPDLQLRLWSEAEAESTRLIDALRDDPPALWFTYHCHYKSPDLLGPTVADALDLAYVISEPSLSPKRRGGTWSSFARLSEGAIARADRLFWVTERDRPALADAGYEAKMVQLAPFVDPGLAPPLRGAGEPLKLLTVAMMRPGDKAESYRRLAAAISRLSDDWRLTLIGHGPQQDQIMSLFAEFGDRVTRISGVTDPSALRPHYEAADLLVWPGVNEGIGMVWFEAMAAGLPVVAENGPAARTIAPGAVLSAPDNPADFAAAIEQAAVKRAALSRTARAHVEHYHSIDRAAATLRTVLRGLIQ